MPILLSVAPFVGAAILTLIINALLPGLGWGWSWMMGVNIAAFITYAYDKSIAGHGLTRVPEVVLHLLTLLGGTIGSFAAMRIFHHKTLKRPFQLVFWAIVIVQIVVIVLWVTRR